MKYNLKEKWETECKKVGADLAIHVSDWWLKEFYQFLQEIEDKIEREKKKVEWLTTTDITKALTRGSEHYGFNLALSKAQQIIKEEITRLK